MTFERAMVILFTKAAQTVIAERFTHTFFDNDGNRARKIFAYSFSVFIAIFVNLFFYKPIFNFLSIFLGLSAIALSYNGTIKRKCIFVFYILAVSCIIDLVVSAFLIKPFGYDGYSAFVSIFALLLLHAAQLITERFFGNNLGIELNNRYWLFIIASLLVCIISSIVIFMDKTVSSFSLSLVCGAFLLVNIIISYLMDDLVKSSQKALENQALSLLYGDEKYGNILLYGEKDKDYKLKDGIAEACDGGSLDDDYLTKLSLNLFVNVYPTKNEKYVDNRKKEFFDFYDNATLSPFIGFEPDTKNMGRISTDLDDFMTGLHGATVDDTLDGAVQKLTADGMDSYLESVRSQWEEYKQ